METPITYFVCSDPKCKTTGMSNVRTIVFCNCRKRMNVITKEEFEKIRSQDVLD